MRLLPGTCLRVAATALTATTTLASTFAEPAKVSLKPNLTPGYEAKVVMETERTVTLEVTAPGAAKEEKSTTGSHTIEGLFKVERSDASGAVVTFRVDRIEMKAKTMRGGEFEWKSTDPRTPNDSTNRALSTMRPALGATLTFELDASGNLTKAENGGVQVSPGDLADFINIVVSGPDMRNRWSPILSPRKSDYVVAVGDSWTGEEKLNKPPFGIFTATTNYTLKSATENEATVDFDGKYTLDAAGDGAQKLFDVTNSSVKGSIVWDRTLGLFKTYEILQRVELRGSAQGFPMAQKTETHVKIRREPTAAARK